MSFVNTLMHHGMVYVGLPYACPELADISEVKGGSPWGAATIAGADGSRQPSAKELAMARFQGKHVRDDHRQTARLSHNVTPSPKWRRSSTCQPC